jgi:hypothetical protein
MQPYHKVQVDVVKAQALQRAVDTLLHALVPWVVELGGDPDLLTRNAGILDALTNLLLVAICQGSVNVAVASLEGRLDSVANLTRLGLPCSKTNSGDLGASVEREVLLCPVLGCHVVCVGLFNNEKVLKGGRRMCISPEMEGQPAISLRAQLTSGHGSGKHRQAACHFPPGIDMARASTNCC